MDFSEYNNFQEHVIDKHEEGKEYVICKLCKAPVRDLRLHHRTKHPHAPLPKHGQMRAVVWYDFSGIKRKRDRSKPNFKEGYHISPKNNMQPMHYRSGLELDAYQLLDAHEDVYKYEVEPKDCITEYFWQGEVHKYFPDLKITYITGKIEIWEIKPSDQTDLPQNEAKWDACSRLVSHRGHSFVVKTEQGIERLRKEVNKANRNEKI